MTRGRKDFQELEDVMNNIYTVKKDDLGVNLYLDSVTVFPDKEDIKNVEDTFTLLTNIALPSISMQSYTYNFVEKFGTNTEVPLNVVIDDNLGIGLPTPDDKSKDGLEDVRLDISNYFSQKIDKALLNNENVVLTKRDLNNIQNIENKYALAQEVQKFPESFDVCLTLNNQALNNHYNHSMYISDILGSPKGLSMKGRFRKFDNSSLTSRFEKIYSEYDLCDINVLPSNLEYSNLTNNKHYGNYELSVGVSNASDKKDIQFNNILVGYSEDGLYVKSKTTGHKIMLLEENMLNDQLKSPIVQLLLHISSNNNVWWFDYPWSSSKEVHAVIPQISFKNIVISPRTWFFQFSYASILTKEISFDEFKERFLMFAKDYMLPEIFYYVENDNRIVSYLKKESSLYSIYKSAKKGHLHFLKLEKLENGKLNPDYTDEEAVFTLTSRKTSKNKVGNKELSKYEYSPVSPKNLISHWIYLNLKFGTENWKNVFIKENLGDIFSKFTAFYERKFFIQYATENNFPTIRLRFKCQNSIKTAHLTVNLSTYLNKLINSGHISDYAFCNYYPEVFRYGGTNLISKSEQVFDIDSSIAENILTIKTTKVTDFYIIFSCLNYVFTAYHDIENAVRYLESFNSLRNKKTLNQWIRQNENEFSKIMFKIDESTLSLLNKRNAVTQSIFDSIHNKSYKEDVLSSFLHMACNRSLGIDRQKESRVMYLTYQIVKNASYKKQDKIFNLFTNHN